MENLFKYDPLLFKYPKGVIKKQQKVTFSVKVSKEDDALKNADVYFCLKNDNEKNYKEIKMVFNNFLWQTEYCFSNAGHYFYHFKITHNENTWYLSKTFDNFSVETDGVCDDFFQSVIEEDYQCENSMQGGIIYQIFVDRFCKIGETKTREPLVFRDDWGGKIQKNTKNPIKINEEVFGGNFKGVISKLDYLKELGVTTIYFNPICMANSNHKYDTADYMKVDPMFGTDEDFKNLINESKKRNMNIVIDGVYNHTGSDSIYFNRQNRFDSVGAYNSKDSKYYSWYDFQEYPNKYSAWWGINTLPAIKDNTQTFEDYIAGKNGVIEKYMDMGVFGVRLDVVDEINDNFVKKISNKVKEYGNDKVVMGEVWEDASTKISYSKRRKYFSNNELNSVMNYPIKEAILSFIKDKEPRMLISAIRMINNNYPKIVIDNLMNFLSTHDTSRIFSELKNIANGNNELAKKYLKICYVLLSTMQGVPSIFYGDEYGMENNDGSSRGCFDWENNKNEIFYFVKELAKIRKEEPLKNGDLKILYSDNGKFVYSRNTKNERIIVCVNLRNSPLKITFNNKIKNFFTNKIIDNYDLKENEFAIFIDK